MPSFAVVIIRVNHFKNHNVKHWMNSCTYIFFGQNYNYNLSFWGIGTCKCTLFQIILVILGSLSQHRTFGVWVGMNSIGLSGFELAWTEISLMNFFQMSICCWHIENVHVAFESQSSMVFWHFTDLIFILFLEAIKLAENKISSEF